MNWQEGGEEKRKSVPDRNDTVKQVESVNSREDYENERVWELLSRKIKREEERFG